MHPSPQVSLLSPAREDPHGKSSPMLQMQEYAVSGLLGHEGPPVALKNQTPHASNRHHAASPVHIRTPIEQPRTPDPRSINASLMPNLRQKLLKELNKTPTPSDAAVEQAALQVLKVSRDILTSYRAAATQGSSMGSSFATHPDDVEYHNAVSRILHKPGDYPAMTEGAMAAVLEAYGNLAAAGSGEVVHELAQVEGLVEGLMCAAEHGSQDVRTHAVFVLSQLAIAGPETAMQMALLPGLAEECCRAISSGSKSERVTLNWALLVNNVAAMGGEDAARALTAHSMLVRELGAWLDGAHDTATLQRLTGTTCRRVRACGGGAACAGACVQRGRGRC